MRETWDKFFMKIAREVATRATCNRKHVGCLLVKDNHILATGYNGSVPKMGHCDDERVGHLMIGENCLRTTHAEQNSISWAAKHGISVDGSTAYITCEPCWTCFKLLVTCGVTRIVFSDTYNSEDKELKKQKSYVISFKNIKYEKFVE